MSTMDYDRAFGSIRGLRSLHTYVTRIELVHAPYRIVAPTPFYQYDNGLPYQEEVTTIDLVPHFCITDECFRLDLELESLAKNLVRSELSSDATCWLEKRTWELLPKLTQLERFADRFEIQQLKRGRLLN